MKKNIVLFVLMLGITAGVLAKETTSTVDFWQTFGVDFIPAKGFKLYLEKQLRFEDEFTNLESDISEIGARYRLAKFLDFRVNYRFVSRTGEKRNRFDGNLQLNFKWNNLRLTNRVRLQNEAIDDQEDNYSELEFRNRLRLTFKRKAKIRPFVGGEI
ncbi:MAG: DUF2490 domain-containing protein, partial [bacterium]|nr:DUF2490 domain-containing protein [bacterium]